MERDDREVVLDAIECFNRRDVPALLERIDAQCEWVPLNAVLEGDVYRGHDGIHRFIGDVDEDIENMTLHVDTTEQRGAYVFVQGSLRGRGRGSGMDLDLPLGWLMHVHEGRVDYLRAYPKPDDALAAAEAAGEGREIPFGPPPRALDS